MGTTAKIVDGELPTRRCCPTGGSLALCLFDGSLGLRNVSDRFSDGAVSDRIDPVGLSARPSRPLLNVLGDQAQFARPHEHPLDVPSDCVCLVEGSGLGQQCVRALLRLPFQEFARLLCLLGSPADGLLLKVPFLPEKPFMVSDNPVPVSRFGYDQDPDDDGSKANRGALRGRNAAITPGPPGTRQVRPAMSRSG